MAGLHPLAVLCFFVGLSAAGAAGGRALFRFYQRWRIRRRLGAPVSAASLHAHEGKLVVLRGVLVGGDLTTRFGPAIRTIADVHPDAASSRPDSLALKAQGSDIELRGSVQVVVGTREEHGRSRSVRSVDAGSEVLVTGIVVRADDVGYREARHALAALPSGAWAERPLGVFAVERSFGPLLIFVLGLLMVTTASTAVLVRWMSFGTSSQSSGGVVTSICREDILARLAKNDLFGAEAAAAGCNDEFARARAWWAVGRVDEAARAYQAARTADPALPFTLSEAEANVVSQPRDVTRLALERMQKDWYRGLPDRSQRALACFASGAGTSYRPCLPEANLQFNALPRAFADPVGVVTNTFHFALRLPSNAMPPWSNDYDSRCERAGCQAAKPAAYALFAGIAADTARAASEFAILDRILSETPPSPPNRYGYGISEAELEVQQAFSVAAVAAWFVHDEAHLSRYLGRTEAHVRSTLEQHLALGRGARVKPQGDASQWSSVDIELHGIADHEAPQAFIRRLRDLKYAEPLRLLALLGARPALQAEARQWVEGEFVPVCRDCGIFAMLEATAKRREAARIVGAKELEAKLAEVSRRFGEVWFRDASRELLWGLEVLYASGGE